MLNPWRLGEEAYKREPQTQRTKTEWFVAGWNASRKRLPITFHEHPPVETAFEEYDYCPNCKGDGVGPKQWFEAGFYRFESWARKQLDDGFSPQEVDNR
jgi:hypothetical protein